MKIFDIIIDILIIIILLYTVFVTVSDPIMCFMLALLGFGALYNNAKYLFKKFKKNNKK